MTSAQMNPPVKLHPVKSLDITTEGLIREIKQGVNVEGNFRQLFERSYARIHRYFQRKGFSPEDSSDLAQDTFLAVYKGLKGFRQESPFENWLFSIAENIWRSALGHRRAKKRDAPLRSLDEEVAMGDDEPSPLAERMAGTAADQLDHMIEKEKREKLHEAIQQLPEQMRRCVELRVLYDFRYSQIAMLMNISINTVKAHLNQAKKELGELLKPYFDGIEL
jgi:RNA polymerase sigma-70 factor, ECF subfamily